MRDDEGLSEDEKEDIKDILDDIDQDMELPPYDYDRHSLYSKRYKDFKEEEEDSKERTRYESLCASMASYLSLSADEGMQEKLNPPLRLLGWNLTPGMVLSATVGVAVISFFAWMVLFGVNIMLGAIIPVSLMVVALSVPIGLSVYTFYKPIFDAKNKVIRSSGDIIFSVLYMVVYLRQSPNLEGAIRFAALNLEGPISNDLKQVLWDVEVGKYSSVDESLEEYTRRWKNYNDDYLESLNMIKVAINESNTHRRENLLQDAIDNILGGTKEKMKHYAQNLETPVMIINAMGAMLPVLGMIMLPLISAFLGGVISPLHLIIIFNILLPVFLYVFMQKTLSSRPPTIQSKPSDENLMPKRGVYHFELAGRKLSIPTWSIGLSIFLVVSFYGIVGYISFPAFYPVDNLDPAQVPGIFLSGESAAPLPMLLRSLSITLGLGLGIGVSKLLGNTERKAAESDIEKIESQFPNALFELGNKISGGTPVELALEKAAESTSDMEISNLFRDASNNIRRMGMTFEESLFDEEYGAIRDYPSQTIQTIMRAVLSSSQKGNKMAATAMTTISRYLKNIHDTQEQLNDLMEDTTTTIQLLAYMLAPVISGVAVGMSQTIITALYSLGETFTQTQGNLPAGQSGASGAGLGFLDNLDSVIPPELLQFVVGIYLLQLLYILGTFYMKITHGEDPTYKNLFIGKVMISGMVFYTITVLMISLMFGGLVTGIGGGLS